MSQYILALDQGTTSSRAIAFDRSGRHSRPSQQSLPPALSPGRLGGARPHGDLGDGAPRRGGGRRAWRAAWPASASPTSGRPPFSGTRPPAGRCTTPSSGSAAGRRSCEELKRQGLEERIQSATGLLIDAYFSATKIRWVLDNVPGAREKADRGTCCSVPWKAGSSGSSPARMSRTTPTPPAPCF